VTDTSGTGAAPGVQAVATAWASAEAAGVRWREPRGIARAVTLLFGVVGVAALFRAGTLAHRLVVLDGSTRDGFWSRAGAADSLVTTADVVFLLAVLALAPCFIVWCWRAAKNQQALGRAPERLGSGWAVGGWFIPLANFVIPVLVVQDLWRGSDVAIAAGDPRWRIAERSWLVGWWWGLFLVPLFIGLGADAQDSTTELSTLRGQNLLAFVAMLAAFVATVLGVQVVRRLDARQAACRDSFAAG
jgi:Domain of unknown function (DUF4328)